MRDPWQQVIRAIEPQYEELKHVMDVGPKVKPTLYMTASKKWRITLEEVWPPEVINKGGTGDLDNRVEWTVETLQEWQGVRRSAWDSWDFVAKREAERFLIFYGLTWG